MDEWTDEDYKRLGMTPPGKNKLADPVVAKKPDAAKPKAKPITKNTNLLREALARRLLESGAE